MSKGNGKIKFHKTKSYNSRLKKNAIERWFDVQQLKIFILNGKYAVFLVAHWKYSCWMDTMWKCDYTRTYITTRNLQIWIEKGHQNNKNKTKVEWNFTKLNHIIPDWKKMP